MQGVPKAKYNVFLSFIVKIKYASLNGQCPPRYSDCFSNQVPMFQKHASFYVKSYKRFSYNFWGEMVGHDTHGYIGLKTADHKKKKTKFIFPLKVSKNRFRFMNRIAVNYKSLVFSSSHEFNI